MKQKFFLISPTTLWIILSSIESLIKDQKIKDNSALIFQYIKDLNLELTRLETRVKKNGYAFFQRSKRPE